jgi:hypothetical protein
MSTTNTTTNQTNPNQQQQNQFYRNSELELFIESNYVTIKDGEIRF